MGLFRSKSSQGNHPHGVLQSSGKGQFALAVSQPTAVAPVRAIHCCMCTCVIVLLFTGLPPMTTTSIACTAGDQSLKDPEAGSTSQSAPESIQPYQQHNQQQAYLVVDRSGLNNGSSSTTNPQWQSTVPNNLVTAISTNQVVYAQQPPTAAPPATAAAVLLPAKAELTPAQRRTLQHLQRLTNVMDTAFTIPGIKVKVGLDGLIGLVSADLLQGSIQATCALLLLLHQLAQLFCHEYAGWDSITGCCPVALHPKSAAETALHCLCY